MPTPKDVLGYHVGAEKKLTYWADQQKWYRALEKALPGRVKTTVIGKTEEGREIMVVYVTSDANLKNLENNRANMRRLADPRGLSADEAKTLIAGTKPHYHLSAGLHSGETNTSEMLMELAYRLAVSDEPYIQQIRDNVIVSMVPTTDIDGRDRYVDWYNAYKINEAYDGGETYGEPPYWGKYVFHDNNRDINYGVDTLRTYLEVVSRMGAADLARPARSADAALHLQRRCAAERQLGSDSLQRPDVLRELRGQQADRLRHAGRLALRLHGRVVAGLSRDRRAEPQRHAADVRDLQPAGRQHEEGALHGRADHAAVVPAQPDDRRGRLVDPQFDQLLGNRRAHRARADLEGSGDGGRELLQEVDQRGEQGISESALRVRDPRRTGRSDKVDRMANLLRVQAIEVQRATSEIKVKEGTFPPGSYVVKLNQPYGPLAKTLLEKQVYPDPALTTYDDSAWTMGLANNVDVRTIEDKSILDAPATLLTADVVTAGTCPAAPPASGSVFVVKHNGALNLVTLRYRLKDVPVRAAQASFKVGNDDYPAGSLIFPRPIARSGRSRRSASSRRRWRRRRPSRRWTSIFRGLRSSRPGRTPRKSAGCGWPSIASRSRSISFTRTT